MARHSSRSTRQRDKLQVVHPNAAAIDIGSRFHVVAIPSDRDPQPVRRFDTFTGDLRRLADWLAKKNIVTIAMESTGVYWIPVYELLEERGFDVILVNAREAKNVPGRKTDINDAQWLQRLHSYGLLRGSFRPTQELASLRALLRQRERLLEYCASHIQHMQKALMEMNLQLHHVVSDITGRTGMRILRAIVQGQHDSAVLASFRDPRCKAVRKQFVKAWRATTARNIYSHCVSLSLCTTLTMSMSPNAISLLKRLSNGFHFQRQRRKACCLPLGIGMPILMHRYLMYAVLYFRCWALT